MHDNTITSNLFSLISEPVQQQPLLTDQPPVNVQPQSLTFSEDMSYDQLAVLLTNHPKLVGTSYQHDISKLKGM